MIRKKNQNDKIIKSKEIIKKEREKIKEEKCKIRMEKSKKFYNTKFGKLIKKILITKDDTNASPSLKGQIFSVLYFEFLGFILCILLMFVLSGGKNLIRLYKELSKFIDVYDTITSNYYGELDKEELVNKAIESMMKEAGDSYTTYTDKEVTDSFLENVDGSYEGIGCYVSMTEDGSIYVLDVFDDGPAQKAGIQAGDIILKIDGENYQGKTSEDMSNYVKNNQNSKITLVIKRDDQEKEFTIVREKVSIPSVSSKVIESNDKKIGYIDISIFSAVTTEQFKEQLEELEKKNIQGLVIDVRDNTGGYLNTVTDIVNLFLKKGEVIYQLEDDDGTKKIKDTTKESRNYPIAVLVNAASASASEILASAIKESYDGYVVGMNTYGKGTVQQTKQLSDGSMIKYTVQKWLTPDGNWINETGVTPTNKVELNSETETDEQLEAALELLEKDIK